MLSNEYLEGLNGAIDCALVDDSPLMRLATRAGDSLHVNAYPNVAEDAPLWHVSIGLAWVGSGTTFAEAFRAAYRLAVERAQKNAVSGGGDPSEPD